MRERHHLRLARPTSGIRARRAPAVAFRLDALRRSLPLLCEAPAGLLPERYEPFAHPA